jgi:hypothetical protein
LGAFRSSRRGSNRLSFRSCETMTSDTRRTSHGRPSPPRAAGAEPRTTCSRPGLTRSRRSCSGRR